MEGIQMNYETSSFSSDQPAPSPSVAATRPLPATDPTTVVKNNDAGEKLAAEMAVFCQVTQELKLKRNPSAAPAERRRCILATAAELFGVAPTWTAFYRETVGVDGVVRSLFSNPDELFDYENSDEHNKVLEMLTVLRSRDLPDCDPSEQQRMITVRIPKSLHDAICDEANQLSVSVNKLCITRLLQRVDRSLIPSSTQKRRGRRPGAAYAKATPVETVDAQVS